MSKTAVAPADAHASLGRIPARGYAGFAADKPLGPWSFERRTPGPDDVHIDIMYCGVCHSDLHTVRDEWGGATYPLVPGHEIVGRVRAVGARVTRFAPGDMASVGCMVDSCRQCPECRMGEEIYCSGGGTFTYNSPDQILGGPTYGGYSDQIVVTQDFVFKVDKALDPAGAAPLLCAGITT
ncbi:MAG TPA: alcohol dehydrogenase catalytic domain-containing protein [Gemmatimonadales bacterium]|nr:alcohol dehydrogenase catalytic domain-containing protein [Gemmatimonadales bacterium]